MVKYTNKNLIIIVIIMIIIIIIAINALCVVKILDVVVKV